MRYSLAVILLLGLSTALPAAEPTSEAQDPRALLQSMTELLANTAAFHVSMRIGYDVMQPTGQKIQFLETRELSLGRPDRLRVESMAGDGCQELLLFDGKTMTVWDKQAGVYAQVPQPGTVDDAIVYFVRDLQMRLPLSALLTTRATEEITSRLLSVEYVEQTSVLGTPAIHLAGRMDGVDFQVWIATEARPLPLRIVLTYLNPGLPSFWADFADWNLQPVFNAASFSLSMPPDAQKIAFAVQLRPVADETGADKETQ